MSTEASHAVGTVAWFDPTVADAVAVRDFYAAAVVGRRPERGAQGGADDFNMTAATGGPPVAGICHARGEIAEGRPSGSSTSSSPTSTPASGRVSTAAAA